MSWPELERRPYLPPQQCRRVDDMLRAAPWLRNEREETSALPEPAAAHDGPLGPAELGCVPLLSVTVGEFAGYGDLWALRLEASNAHEGRFARETVSLWTQIAADLPRYLPLILSSVHEAGELEITAAHVTRAALPDTPARVASHLPPLTLSGDSFGLSFVLSQVSWLLELTPPQDVACTARVAHGRLEEVEGVALKVCALLEGTSRISRLIVARRNEAPGSAPGPSNAEEARAAALTLGRHLEVVEAATVQEAVALAFPDLTRDALAAFERRVFRQEQPMPEIVRSACIGILNMALATQAWMGNWTPLRTSAQLLLERWDALLSETDRWLLTLVVAITRRHQGEDVAIEPLGDAGMQELPDDLKRRVVAQLVQQAHDSDKMEHDSVRELASQYLHSVPPAARTLTHHQLRGALARLRRLAAAVLSDPAAREREFEACAVEQLAIAHDLRRLDIEGVSCLGELSYQISELYLLASLSDSRERFARAESLRLEFLDSLDATGMLFVDIARARACAFVGIDLDWAHERLRLLSLDPEPRAAHVQRSAHRLLARLLRTRGHAYEAEEVVRRMRALPPSDGDDGAIFLLLADVDRWSASEASPIDEDALIAQLQSLCLQRQMMGFGRFVQSGAPRDRLFRLQRLFPY